MSLQQQFNLFIRKEKLFNPGQRLLLAVSGGVDSVVLAHLVKNAGFDFSIAHCNFGLRGNESDSDEEFVKELAAVLNAGIHVREFDTRTYAQENKLSIQEAARNLRYEWFKEILNENPKGEKYDVILTAHHADDNAETILMNFFKGTGVKGLKGISPKNGKICRPLLFADKRDIIAYAGTESLAYREDPSNFTEKYTRNYFRLKVIPELEKLWPGITGNIKAQAEKFRELKVVSDLYFYRLKKKLIVAAGDNTEQISVLKLKKQPALNTVMYEIISAYNFKSSQIAELEKLLIAPSGKYIVSSTHRILKNRNWLIISELQQQNEGLMLIEDEGTVLFPGGSIKTRILPDKMPISNDRNIALLDQSEISFPLILRKWKQGDYFYPLGMKKKKKLSRFFIDSKFSLAKKENTWVIESNKRILWIVGHRIDDRFKIVDSTKRILSLELMPKKGRVL